MSESMIERVARALFLDRFPDSEDYWPDLVGACELGSQRCFRLPDLIVAKNRLALEVGAFDLAVVDDGQLADSGPCKRGDSRAPYPAGANNRDRCRFQLALPDTAHLPKHDVPRITVQLVVA